jgi:hypothetical protein
MPIHNPDGTPSDDSLRLIRQFLPQIKAETNQKRVVETGKKAGIKIGDKLCGICARVIKIHSKNPDKKFCGVCQGRLGKGETALVTLDGRFVFVAPDKMLQSLIQAGTGIDIPDEKGKLHHISSAMLRDHIKGHAIGILPNLMDVLEVKFKAAQDANAEQN